MVERKLPSARQIKAAICLFEQLPGLKLHDTILWHLKETYEDFSKFDEILLRVLAINEFYWAGCSDLPNMTNHLRNIGEEILERYENRRDDEDYIKIVEDIALMGKTKKEYGDGCVVFASKFAHFFKSPNAFPIVDQYSEKMLQDYFVDAYIPKVQNGKKAQKKGNRYRHYFINFQRYVTEMLNSWDDEDKTMITIKTIDQYLWLAGICNALDQNPNAQVNGIIKMKRNDPLFKVLFDRLQGKTGE